MDPRVAEHFSRAQSARVRVADLRARQGPVSRFLLTVVGLGVFAVAILVVLLLIPVILALGLLAAAVFTVRRKLAGFGRPNSSIGGVRTDGRSNVRVITRD